MTNARNGCGAALLAAGWFLLSTLAGCSGQPEADPAPPPVATSDSALNLLGTLTFGPTSVRSSPNTIDVFVPGGDYDLYTRRFNETTKTWTAWSQIDYEGLIRSGLSSVIDGAGKVRIFSAAPDINGFRQVRLSWNGSAWVKDGSWMPYQYPAGGLSADAPGVTIDQSGITHVFMSRADNHNLVHTSCTVASCAYANASWTAWDNNALPIYSSPAVVSLAPGEFNLYFKGKDARMRESLFRSSGPPFYTLSWSAPVDLGEGTPMWSYTASNIVSSATVAAATSLDTLQGAHAQSVSTSSSYGYTGSCGGAGHEAVAKLVLTQDARVQLDTFGAGYDTVLYVRDGNGTTQTVDKNGVVACNDDTPGVGAQSSLDLSLKAGTYYVFADSFYTGDNGYYPLHYSISYFNTPAVTVRASGVIDLYSVETDNRLYVASKAAAGWTSWSLINGPEPIGDGGDYQQSAGLGATASSKIAGCSFVFGRSFPWKNLIYKGCGETVTFSLDNYAGGQWTSAWGGPVPNFPSYDPAGVFSPTWGQKNSAWNKTRDFGATGNASGNSALYLTARWPTELYAFDFDDHRTSWTNAWDLYENHDYVTLFGYKPATGGGLGWDADHGAEVTSKAAYLPGGVKTTRLIDHGACVTRVKWNDGLPYSSSTPHTGLLNQLQIQLNNALYTGVSRGLYSAGATSWSTYWDVNRFEPSFAHFAVDGVTGIHSDGIKFAQTLRLVAPEATVTTTANGQYTIGLEQGLPRLYTIDPYGYFTSSISGWVSVLTFVVNLVSDLVVAGSYLDPGALALRAVTGNIPWASALPPSSSGCDGIDASTDSGKGAQIRCRMQYEIPDSFARSVAQGMTAILGDPMAYKTCSTTSDCTGKPYQASGGEVWECHYGRCMVPIHAGEVGYLSSSTSSNYRTEFDSGLGALPTCEPVSGGTSLSSADLSHCQFVLQKALMANGVPDATAEAWSKTPSMVANNQYGCVQPQRPNCPGDNSGSFVTGYSGYYGGYPCRNSAPATGQPGTGIIGPGGLVDGRCTWHPAMKRVNVLPTAMELVWSEADSAPSIDEQIVKALSPAQACRAPSTYETDVSSATSLPRVVHEGRD